MKNFLVGTLFGIVISTVGFSGITKIIDHGIEKTKQIAAETAK